MNFFDFQDSKYLSSSDISYYYGMSVYIFFIVLLLLFSHLYFEYLLVRSSFINFIANICKSIFAIIIFLAVLIEYLCILVKEESYSYKMGTNQSIMLFFSFLYFLCGTIEYILTLFFSITKYKFEERLNQIFVFQIFQFYFDVIIILLIFAFRQRRISFPVFICLIGGMLIFKTVSDIFNQETIIKTKNYYEYYRNLTRSETVQPLILRERLNESVNEQEELEMVELNR